jgi:MFS transporter, SP family, sugar:H+ symporter
MITIGILVAASVNSIIITYVKGDLEWRLAMGIQCVPAILLLVVMFFMPCSPRWLATKGRDAEAIEIIAHLRSETVNDPGTLAEYKQITDAVEIERSVGNGSWGELLVPGLRNRLALAMLIQMWQQFTGINVILYYQNSLLTGMGIDKDQASIPFTLANDFINFLATFPGMYLVDILGRRKLLILGGFGMGTAHFLVCMFVGLSKSTGIGALSWGAIFSVYLFFFCFASTWGPIAWVYQSEIFPLRVRAKGTGAATMTNWLANAFVALITPYLSEGIGFYMYLIYGCTGFSMAIFTYFFVPETMGRSIEEMDEVFGKPQNKTDFESTYDKTYERK